MKYFSGLICVALLHLASSTVKAGFIVEIKEVGADVVAIGSGTLDISGLQFVQTTSIQATLNPGALGTPLVFVGPANTTSISSYRVTITGPSSFGSGENLKNANSGSGNKVGIAPAANLLFVPFGYVSNSPLSFTSTWTNQSFSTLGVTEGTYVWSWDSGANSDSYTLNITSVPEPSSVALVGLVVVVALTRLRFRRL